MGYVGGLSTQPAPTEDDLRRFFDNAGCNVTGARVIMDKWRPKKGRSRGFGFVYFADSDSVNVALMLDGAEAIGLAASGRNLQIKGKKQKKPMLPAWSGPTDLKSESLKGYDPQTATWPQIPNRCKITVQGEDLADAEYPWESHAGRRCPVILSVRFDEHAQTGKWTNPHESASARVVAADFLKAYTGSGGYVYYPSIYDKDICEVYTYTPAVVQGRMWMWIRPDNGRCVLGFVIQ